MIRYSLRCDADHRFEGWFPSGDAFDEQQAAGLLACPDCGSPQVGKALMAPAVVTRTPVSTLPPDVKSVLRALRRHVEATCEPVGSAFAEEARKIHEGEAPTRQIYGEATPQEAEALIEDGIEIGAIPWVALTDD